MDNIAEQLQHETAEREQKLLAGRKPRKVRLRAKKEPPKLYVAAPQPSAIFYCTCGAPVPDTAFGRQQHYFRMPECYPRPGAALTAKGAG